MAKPNFVYLRPTTAIADPGLDIVHPDGKVQTVSVLRVFDWILDRDPAEYRHLVKLLLVGTFPVRARFWYSQNRGFVYVEIVGNFVIPNRDGDLKWVHALRWRMDMKNGGDWETPRVPMVPTDKAKTNWRPQYGREDAVVKAVGISPCLYLSPLPNGNTRLIPYFVASDGSGAFDRSQSRYAAQYFNPASLSPTMEDGKVSSRGNFVRWTVSFPERKVFRFVAGQNVETTLPAWTGEYTLTRFLSKEGIPMFKLNGEVVTYLFEADQRDRKVVLGMPTDAFKDGSLQPEAAWNAYDCWAPAGKQLADIQVARVLSGEFDLAASRIRSGEADAPTASEDSDDGSAAAPDGSEQV
jgi:hypothetical protein